ncbi:MAG: hypothetical protein NTW87_05840 [Planctomycetota bacterium]|nr:hypothetical protein [Planctomycetota bacterium]
MGEGTPQEPVSPAATPRKRPFFQFHLSTAVVLMFVAGVLLWANLQTPLKSFVMLGRGSPPFQNLSPVVSVHHGTTTNAQGFPFEVREYYTVETEDYSHWKKGYLILDILCAALALLLAAGACRFSQRCAEKMGWSPNTAVAAQFGAVAIFALNVMSGRPVGLGSHFGWPLSWSGRDHDAWAAIAWDVAAGLWCITVIGVICEWLIRRRERSS